MGKRYKKIPELIAPAGDWSALSSALHAGCDAVYFGIKEMNMRSTAINFDMFEIKKVMKVLHKNNRKGYLALNILVHDRELGKVKKILEAGKDHGIDAVILWDMAVFSIAKELGLKIHMSTQASVANFSALKFYSSLGAERIILARECMLSDIKKIISKIKEENIPCDVESFIHGAMCMSISGRCLLSQYSFSKSANRGLCVQPCRREYTIIDKEAKCSYVLGNGYLLSPKDLCTIGFIDTLIDAGIGAFKIEGRGRSSEYVAGVTSAYRRAIDAAIEHKLTGKLKTELLIKLKQVYNRSFADGFYFNRPDDLGGKVATEYEKIFLGDVRKFYKKINVAEIVIRNKSLKLGQKILIMGKSTPACFTEVSHMEVDHKPVRQVKKGEAVGLKIPFIVRPKDKIFLWRDHGKNT